MELKVTSYTVSNTGVATVKLDRPDRGNAWTARMHTEYRWIMSTLEADPAVKVAVLTGSGKCFSVGADSRALETYVDAEGFDTGLADDVQNPGYGVRPEFDADIAWQLGLRFPLICAVNGACAGVGLALAAFADIRFAVEGAKVTTATAKLAMPAEYGLSWILPKLIGMTHSADLLLSGRILMTEELGSMGFFNRVFAKEDFERGVFEYAELFAGLSSRAVMTTKRQLWEDTLHFNLANSVERSKELIGDLMQYPDYAEGVKALVEKRAPHFTDHESDT